MDFLFKSWGVAVDLWYTVRHAGLTCFCVTGPSPNFAGPRRTVENLEELYIEDSKSLVLQLEVKIQTMAGTPTSIVELWCGDQCHAEIPIGASDFQTDKMGPQFEMRVQVVDDAG